MVRAKALQAEYVKEFITERKKVITARNKCVDELDQIIKALAPKLKQEYDRGFKHAFKDFDAKMKLYEFLRLDTVKNEPTIVERTQITIKSKSPRTPRPEEILFSIDGTPIRI